MVAIEAVQLRPPAESALYQQGDMLPPSEAESDPEQQFLDWFTKSSLMFVGHGYQPLRYANVDGHEIFDIRGQDHISSDIHPREWNEVLFRRCYVHLTKPLEQPGVDDPVALLSHPTVGADIFGPLRDWIRKYHPEEFKTISHHLESQPFAIADPYIHAILPLQHPQVADLLIDIGLSAYREDVSDEVVPLGFWPPELAITMDIADRLAKKGVSFVILNEHQIESDEYAAVYRIELPSEKPFFVIPYAAGLSRDVAFSDIKDAGAFIRNIRNFTTHYGFPPVACVDMETIGYWREHAQHFLNYMAHSPEGFLSTNPADRRENVHVATGVIKDSSWSCAHGFGRWDGTSECTCDGATDHDRVEKNRLYSALRKHQDAIIAELQCHEGWEAQFKTWFMSIRQDLGAGMEVTTDAVDT